MNLWYTPMLHTNQCLLAVLDMQEMDPFVNVCIIFIELALFIDETAWFSVLTAICQDCPPPFTCSAPEMCVCPEDSTSIECLCKISSENNYPSTCTTKVNSTLLLT